MTSEHGDEPTPQPSDFRRLHREHARLDSLDLYAHVVGRTGGPIADKTRIDGAMADIRRELIEVTGQAGTLHGWRAQALFEAIVASLGSVRLLKLEDAGDVFFSGESLKPPDFRIITADRDQFLVEVKNFHQTNPRSDYRIRRQDLEGLQRYTQVVGVGSLKFAIYWTRWNTWTLTDASRFQPDGSKHLTLSLPEAAKANEMGSLGDRMLGTEWPIGLTFYSDPTKARTVNDDGEADFTIGRAEYTVAGRVVMEPAEQNIVHRLMLFGGWKEDTDVEIVDGDVVSTSFMFSPEEPPPAPQQFAMHGPLSSVFSAMFTRRRWARMARSPSCAPRSTPALSLPSYPTTTRVKCSDYGGFTSRLRERADEEWRAQPGRQSR